MKRFTHSGQKLQAANQLWRSAMALAAVVALSGASSTRFVQAAEPAANKNYMGLGIANPGVGDAMTFADLMRAANRVFFR